MRKVSKKYFSNLSVLGYENYDFECRNDSFQIKSEYDQKISNIRNLLDSYRFHLELHFDDQSRVNNELISEKYEWNEIPFIAFAKLHHDLLLEERV